MDILAKRQLLQRRLVSATPSLPPLHNLRVLSLDQPLKSAEIELHNARIALEELVDGCERGLGRRYIETRRKALGNAMAVLETREREYFKTRYMSNKRCLLGWCVANASAKTAAKKKQALAKLANNLTTFRVKGISKVDARLQRIKVEIKASVEKQKDDLASIRREVERLEHEEKREQGNKKAEAVRQLLKAQAKFRREVEKDHAKQNEQKMKLKAAAEAQKVAMEEAAAAAEAATEFLDRINKRDVLDLSSDTDEREIDQKLADVSRANRHVVTLGKQTIEEEQQDDYASGGWEKEWTVLPTMGGGDCLFHAIAAYTHEPVGNLRQELVRFMRDNLDLPLLPNDALTLRQVLQIGINAGEYLKVKDTTNGNQNELVLPQSVDDYLRYMELGGTYCTQVEKTAYQMMRKRLVHVVIKQDKVIAHPPPYELPREAIVLRYNAPAEHYQALKRLKVEEPSVPF